MTVRSRIIGCGSYLPSNVVTNDELAKRVDTSDEWIVARTGIRQRHIAAEGETTSDLAVAAATRAMEHAGVTAADIDMIIVATATPDNTFPATATKVQHRLGVVGFAFDVQAVCSGFVYALTTADMYIRNGQAKNGSRDRGRNIFAYSGLGRPPDMRFVRGRSRGGCCSGR